MLYGKSKLTLGLAASAALAGVPGLAQVSFILNNPRSSPWNLVARDPAPDMTITSIKSHLPTGAQEKAKIAPGSCLTLPAASNLMVGWDTKAHPSGCVVFAVQDAAKRNPQDIHLVLRWDSGGLACLPAMQSAGLVSITPSGLVQPQSPPCLCTFTTCGFTQDAYPAPPPAWAGIPPGLNFLVSVLGQPQGPASTGPTGGAPFSVPQSLPGLGYGIPAPVQSPAAGFQSVATTPLPLTNQVPADPALPSPESKGSKPATPQDAPSPMDTGVNLPSTGKRTRETFEEGQEEPGGRPAQRPRKEPAGAESAKNAQTYDVPPLLIRNDTWEDWKLATAYRGSRLWYQTRPKDGKAAMQEGPLDPEKEFLKIRAGSVAALYPDEIRHSFTARFTLEPLAAAFPEPEPISLRWDFQGARDAKNGKLASIALPGLDLMDQEIPLPALQIHLSPAGIITLLPLDDAPVDLGGGFPEIGPLAPGDLDLPAMSSS